MIPFPSQKLRNRRLLVIEQDPLAARGLKDVLESFPEFIPDFIREMDLDSGWRRIKDQDADALLLSIGHITPGAISFVRQIKGHRPKLTVIVISGDDRPDWVSELLQAGVRALRRPGPAPDHVPSAIGAADSGPGGMVAGFSGGGR